MTNRVAKYIIKDSFYHVNDWIDEISKYTGSKIIKVIVGNKYDLLQDKKITNEDILVLSINLLRNMKKGLLLE